MMKVEKRMCIIYVKEKTQEWASDEESNFLAEYDERGNLVHYKRYKTEYWKVYDVFNSLVYTRNAYGAEVWYEYDLFGNVTAYESSDGYREVATYDMVTLRRTSLTIVSYARVG